jgi:MFS family permease
MTTTADIPVIRLRTPGVSHRTGFWVVALGFLATMAFTTIPTPIYAFYARADGFATWVVTVIFAAYAVGVLAALFLVGHISDWVGRRRMLLLGVALQLVAAGLFLVFPHVAGLIIARVVSGFGIGAITATASAHLVELDAAARPGAGPARATTVATVLNTGGLALGPLISGALVTWLPGPTVTPYLLFAGLLVLAVLGIALVPETVVRQRERPAYRPQRVAVPPEGRHDYTAAAIAGFAGFSVFGLFTSLAPVVMTQVMHEPAPLAGGAVTFAVLAASALAQLVFGRLSSLRQLVLALVLVVAGLAALAVGVLTATLAVFAVGGVAAGAGVGLVFRASMMTAGRLAAPERRGEALAGMFLASYLGLAVPVLAIGAALVFAPMTAVLVVFAAAVAVLVVVAALPLVRRAAQA